MNRTYRGGSVTPDPSLFTAVMEGQWEIVREKLLALATTAAIMTAVAISVSILLLFLSLALVVVFRILVVPTTPASTRQELVFDYVSAAPTAVSSFLGAKETKAL